MELRVPVNKAATAGLGLVLKGKSAVESGDDQGAAVFVDRVRFKGS
jgi:predicted Zn-dependent peptidase